MYTMDSGHKCALLIAHPGHEIRIHGWMEKTRPIVYVLTDGSGRAGQSRLASTTRILERAGARPGGVYGRMPDRALYDAVLRGDIELFRNLAAELAGELARERFDVVVGDAAEGTILAHDLWRATIDAAVDIARNQARCSITSYEFSVEPRSNQRTIGLSNMSVRVVLDDDALSRKLNAARSYYELRSEVEAALAASGEESFRTELLKPSIPQSDLESDALPVYEQHGERLVAQGIYLEAVRH